MGWRVVAIAAVASLAVACGSDSASTSTSSSAGDDASTTTTPDTAADVAADRAAAEAASLKLSDFPAGWTSTPPDESNPDVPTIEGELATCLNVDPSELNQLGPAEVDSPDFSDTEDHKASSSISYAATASEAEHSFAIVADPKIPGCLEPAVSKIVTYFLEHPENPSDTVPAGLTLGTPEVAQMSFPTFGDKTIAYRVTVPIQYGPLTINAYIDTVFAIKGRAGVQMSFQGLDTPFPVDDEQRYTDTVVGRLTGT